MSLPRSLSRSACDGHRNTAPAVQQQLRLTANAWSDRLPIEDRHGCRALGAGEKRDVYLQRIAAILALRGRGATDSDVADVARLAMAGLIQTTDSDVVVSHNLFFGRLEVFGKCSKRHRAARYFVDAQLGGNAGDDE